MKSIKLFLLTSALFIYSQVCDAKNVLIELETDYCTGYPEGLPQDPTAWKTCCLIHDMFFWAGGSEEDRDTADLDLKECVKRRGYPFQAQLIYLGVRAGSYSPIKYSDKQWNHGWPLRSTHQKLTQEDIDLIEEELFSGYGFIPDVFKIYFISKLRHR